MPNPPRNLPVQAIPGTLDGPLPHEAPRISPLPNTLDPAVICALSPVPQDELPPNCENPVAGDDQADPDARGV